MESKVVGRYPKGSSILNQHNMEVSSYTSGDYVVIRVDDEQNSDFWLEITLSREQLKEILLKMNKAKIAEEMEYKE